MNFISSKFAAGVFASELCRRNFTRLAGVLALVVVSTATPTRAQGVSFIARRDFVAGARPISVAVGDFNGDGIKDLAVANFYSNNVSVLLGNGDGSFQTATNFGLGLGLNPSSLAVADFNGDGNADLVVANAGSNNLSLLLGNGDGTFQPAVNFGGTQINNPAAIAVGDFNGDGKADLVVANFSFSNLSLLLGNGNGTFQGAVNFGGVGLLRPISIAVRDFNRDGVQDLV